MNRLRKLLQSVPDYYSDFERTIMAYVGGNKGREERMVKFIMSSPEINTSGILNYMLEQDDINDVAYHPEIIPDTAAV